MSDEQREWRAPAPMGRREFMKLMGAALALGGAAGCSPPPEKIVPYAHAPEGMVPGKPVFYATAMALDGYAKGVLVENNMGRPTKVEGNRRHPASLGATDVFAQGSVLGLWDPDRSQAVMRGDAVRPLSDFLAMAASEAERLRRTGGAGLRILTGRVTSPTLGAQLTGLLSAYPEARWHQHQPIGADNAEAGAIAAFGAPREVLRHLERARVIVSLDSDLLGAGPAHLHDARHFASGRQAARAPDRMNRLYVAECGATTTGALADHRLALGSRELETLARLIAARLGLAVDAPAAAERLKRFAAIVADDLARQGAHAIVVAGERQPRAVHVLAHAINARLGAAGKTVSVIDPVALRAPPGRGGTLAELTDALAAGQVHTLLIVGVNPVATAAADLEFASRLERAALSIHLGLYRDETGVRTHWHVPETHYLESWSDARAFDGTASIVQPLVAPLYNGVSVHAVLGALAQDAGRSAHDRVRSHWRKAHPGKDFDEFWRQALADGVLPDTQFPARAADIRPDALAALPAAQDAAESALELVFAPDHSVWDGQFANNAWLQELPRPLTSLTWDNAALLSPHTAQRLGLANGDQIELQVAGRSQRAPALAVPGHPDGTVTAPLGYGRTRAGSVGNGRGFDAYALRASDTTWFAAALKVVKTGAHQVLATTQNHHRTHEREPVRSATGTEFANSPRFAAGRAEQPSLYEPYAYPEYAWAMSINLGACIGCNACTIACQAENNIPVVGRQQVIVGREMHWIRVDSHFAGPPEEPTVRFQPVPCMHCEHAPCELVCPVGATMHDSGGLNVQVYNRCVGTRFCSNNCPYKVRRFNFLQFADQHSLALRGQRNPEVTVRHRGVMEKCTYCLQRITTARIAADRESRTLRDGEVITACQAVCPTNAIVFGNSADPTSAVALAKDSPLDYTLLEEQNTRPRTTYLAKLTNPNPELKNEAG